MARVRNISPAVPVGAIIALVGAWVFFVPLVGPYFDFGFFTNSTWDFTSRHWILLLGPGIAAGLSGLLMVVPSRIAGWAVSLVALLAGLWLVVGPTLHAVWSTQITPITTAQPDAALRWIGYFLGPGLLLTYLSGSVHGLFAAWTRPPLRDEVDAIEPVDTVEPAERAVVEERDRTLTIR
jgi:hypothetical protein